MPKLSLIDDFGTIARKAWSIRLALGGAAFWGAVSMLAAMWPGFAGAMPLWAWALIGVGLGAAVAIARVTKQPGLE